jgi:hypothetical protein
MPLLQLLNSSGVTSYKDSRLPLLVLAVLFFACCCGISVLMAAINFAFGLAFTPVSENNMLNSPSRPQPAAIKVLSVSLFSLLNFFTKSFKKSLDGGPQQILLKLTATSNFVGRATFLFWPLAIVPVIIAAKKMKRYFMLVRYKVSDDYTSSTRQFLLKFVKYPCINRGCCRHIATACSAVYTCADADF